MKYKLTALLCFLQLFVSAQRTEPTIDYKTAITISPLAFLDTDNGLMLGIEHRLSQRLALLFDAAYIFNSYYLDDPEKVRGFTIRPALRRYSSVSEKKGFIQLQWLYKRVNYTLYDWLEKNLVEDVPSYSQLQDFTFRKEVWGVNIMGGFLKSFSSNRFHLDIAGGLGLRFKKQGVTEPNSRFRQTWGIGSEFDSRITTASVPLSIKLAYKLNKE